MAGAKFEYDEQGSTFYYFIISFYALVLLPATYYLWPRKEKKGPSTDSTKCHCEPCQVKEMKLKSKEPWHKFKRKLIKVILVVGWIGFVALAYKVAHIEIEHQEYDPYAILGVDSGATVAEIKKQYRKLSKLHHPDRGGEPKRFVEIAKAYEALTDEDVKSNWEQYGNPDGPGVMRFGIALPSWIVDKENSMLVLAAYILAFMVILPTAVGFWWYRSMRYSADQVLLDTTQLYYYLIHKTPNMMLRRAIMVLGASFEFMKAHNKEIIERPSDDTEVPLLMKELPNLGEKNKERPLCFSYSIKARALIHAHLSRLKLSEKTLEIDKEYVIKKCPILIQEMVTVVAQLVAFANAGRIPKMPSVETMENCMKLAPMMVQAIWENKSALYQLPHCSDEILKYCITRKRHVKSCSDLATLPEEDRRSLLRSLGPLEYQDILNVLVSMPKVTMEVRVEVQDDEDKLTITAGSLVTVYVNLTRVALFERKRGERHGSSSSTAGGDYALSSDGGGYKVVGATDDAPDMDGGDNAGEEENGMEEQNGTLVGAGADEEEGKQLQPKKRVWEKNAKKKKGGKGGGGAGGKKKAQKQPQAKKPQQQPSAIAAAVPPGSSTGPGTPEVESEKKTPKERKTKRRDPSKNDDDGSGSDWDSEDSEVSDCDSLVREVKAAEVDRDILEAEDEEMLFDDEVTRRERMLDTKSRLTHTVHSPFFPEEKQEWWWTYVCDRKRKMLITPPAQVTSLKDTEEIELKFPAPPIPGTYSYQVCLRSDSYMDCDQVKDIKLHVHEARQITEHPQWNFPSDDEDKNSGVGSSNESDYTEGEASDADD